MKILVDSNRLMAALIKDSINRKIILSNVFNFYTPDFTLTEINKHKTYLVKKSNTKPEDFDILLYSLLQNINLVPFEEFKHEFMNAVKIMSKIDLNDSAFVAVGLAMNLDGIWTEDKHFHNQQILKVYKTKELVELLY